MTHKKRMPVRSTFREDVNRAIDWIAPWSIGKSAPWRLLGLARLGLSVALRVMDMLAFVWFLLSIALWFGIVRPFYHDVRDETTPCGVALAVALRSHACAGSESGQPPVPWLPETKP